MTLQHYRTCPTGAQLTLHDSFSRLISTYMSVTQLVRQWHPDSYKIHLAVTGFVKSAPDSSSCYTTHSYKTHQVVTRLITNCYKTDQPVTGLINPLQDSSDFNLPDWVIGMLSYAIGMFPYAGPCVWNNLPQPLHHSASASPFKAALKMPLFNNCF